MHLLTWALSWLIPRDIFHFFSFYRILQNKKKCLHCMFIFLAIIEIQKKNKLKKKIQIEYNLIINKKKKLKLLKFFLTPLWLLFIYYNYEYASFEQTLKIIPSSKRCEVRSLHRTWQGYEATSGNYVLEYSSHQVSEIVWLMTRGSSTNCLVVGIY